MGVVVNRSIGCRFGGSIKVTGNQAVVNSASAGDTLQLTFNDCLESDLGLVTGNMALTVVQSNSGATLLMVDATLTNLTWAFCNRLDRLSGPLRLSFDDRANNVAVIDATSAGLTYTRMVGGTVRSQRTLTNYAYRAVITANGQTSETFSYAASGNFERLGNNVGWSAFTTQPLVTPADADRPISGAGRLLGANGRSVAVTVTPTGLRLDIDHTGDSGTDATSDLTWAQFDAQPTTMAARKRASRSPAAPAPGRWRRRVGSSGSPPPGAWRSVGNGRSSTAASRAPPARWGWTSGCSRAGWTSAPAGSTGPGMACCG